MPPEMQRAIALMDAALPDWRSRIDVDRLDLMLPSRCILGQCWPGVRWWSSVQRLGLLDEAGGHLDIAIASCFAANGMYRDHWIAAIKGTETA